MIPVYPGGKQGKTAKTAILATNGGFSLNVVYPNLFEKTTVNRKPSK